MSTKWINTSSPTHHGIALVPALVDVTLDQTRTLTVTAHYTVARVAMQASATLTLADPNPATRPYLLDIVFTQDATGGRVLTLAGNVTTPGGVPLVLSTAPNAVDTATFVWTGATWRLVNATFGQA